MNNTATHNSAYVMKMVLIAMIPAILVSYYYFTSAILIQIFLCGLFALAFEALILKLRKQQIRKTLSDNSALVTACLLALAIPPLSPWWLSAIGVFFAIICN